LDVSLLLAGAHRRLTLSDFVVLPPFGPFRFGGPAAVEGKVERVERSLLLSGRISVVYEAECDRCLDTARGALEVEIEEEFPIAGGNGDPHAESSVLHGRDLDVADLVRQLVDAALPITVRCAENCRGLCPACGRNRNREPCTCVSEN
jgi:uncharacterized protein